MAGKNFRRFLASFAFGAISPNHDKDYVSEIAMQRYRLHSYYPHAKPTFCREHLLSDTYLLLPRMASRRQAETFLGISKMQKNRAPQPAELPGSCEEER
jgi:hypothetical protein